MIFQNIQEIMWNPPVHTIGMVIVFIITSCIVAFFNIGKRITPIEYVLMAMFSALMGLLWPAIVTVAAFGIIPIGGFLFIFYLMKKLT